MIMQRILLMVFVCLNLVKENICISLSAGRIAKGSAEEDFVEASNSFAVRVYRHLSSDDGNIFFCPSCLSSSMSMMLEVSKGRTYYQLNDVLGFRSARLKLEDIRKLSGNFTEWTRTKNCFSNVANVLFLQDGQDLNRDVMKLIPHDVYNTEIKMADFNGNVQKAVWDINEWVKHKTSSGLKRVLERANPHTQMLLVNGMNLNIDLSRIFPVDLTTKMGFRNHGVRDHLANVTMLGQKGRLQKLATSYDFRAVELSCSNETSIKMWILLPHKVGGLPKVEDSLSTLTFKQLSKALKDQKVDVAIPSIKIRYSQDFTKVLQKIGITDAFSESKADFTLISNKDDFHLTQILHKSMLEINSSKLNDFVLGGHPIPFAALAKNVSVTPIPPFRANHPFLFLMIDTSTGLILYMGRVLEF